MYRIPRNNNLRKSMDEWKQHSWRVELQVNARSCVTFVRVVCRRVDDANNEYQGEVSMVVQPFDNLHKLICELQLESAVLAIRGSEDGYSDVPLPFDE